MTSRPTWKSELWRSFMILVIGYGGFFLVGYLLSRLLPNDLDKITAVLTTSQVLSRLLSPLGLILVVGALALNSYLRIKKARGRKSEKRILADSTPETKGLTTGCIACGQPIQAQWPHCPFCGASQDELELLTEPSKPNDSQDKRKKKKRFAIDGFQRLVLIYLLCLVPIFVWVPWTVDIPLPVRSAEGRWTGKSGQQFAGYAFLWSKPSPEQIAIYSGGEVLPQRLLTNLTIDVQRVAVEFLALSATFALALLIRKLFFKI